MNDEQKRQEMKTIEMFMKVKNQDYYYQRGFGMNQDKRNISVKVVDERS